MINTKYYIWTTCTYENKTLIIKLYKLKSVQIYVPLGQGHI